MGMCYLQQPTSKAKLHWLAVSQRVIFKTGLLVCKTLQGNDPSYLKHLLKLYSADDTMRLQEPAMQYVAYEDRAFSVYGPKVWHSQPPYVRQFTSVKSFKTAAKAHLFRCYYG